VIVSREAAIQAAKKSIAENEEKAADYQRNGRAIPAIVTQEIDKAKADIATSQDVIADKKNDYQAIKDEFEQIIKRLEFLTNTKASSK
jgi:molecular chaperone GrpE (heat shock protein)